MVVGTCEAKESHKVQTMNFFFLGTRPTTTGSSTRLDGSTTDGTENLDVLNLDDFDASHGSFDIKHKTICIIT